jgi:O-antigen ligase
VLIPLDLRIDLGSQPIFLDLAYGIFAIPLLRRLLNGHRKLNLWPLALSGFIVMAVFTTYNRSEKVSWLFVSGLRLEIVLIFATAIANYGKAEKIILAAGWSLVPAVGYGIYQMLIGGLGPLYDLFVGGTETGGSLIPWTGRPFSTFGHPNLFGFYCAIVTAMLMAIVMHSGDRLHRRSALALSLLGVAGTLASDSRGSWMGLAAAIAILAFMGSKRAKYVLAGALLIGLAMYVLSALNLAGPGRTSSFAEETAAPRIALWGAALLMFASHPLTGIGWMNFAPLLTSVINWQYGAGIHPHNVYLSLLAETGLIGFALFLAPVFIILRRSTNRFRSDVAALAGLLGLTVFLVHGLVDVALFSPQAMLMVGVALGLASRAMTSGCDDKPDIGIAFLEKSYIHPEAESMT